MNLLSLMEMKHIFLYFACLLALTCVQACGRRRETPARANYAMYVWTMGYDPDDASCTSTTFQTWDTVDPVCFTHTWNTPAKRKWLWDTCTLKSREITLLFISGMKTALKAGYDSGSCDVAGIDDIEATVNEGHVRGIQIYALFADSDLAVSEQFKVKYMVWYNDNCATATSRFDGVAVNNEAVSTIKCTNPGQAIYLDNLNAIKTEAALQTSRPLKTHYSMGWHWGECPGGTANDVAWNGKTAPMTEHMIDMFDSTDVQVAWHTASTSVSRATSAGMAYAESLGKPMYITVYTNKVDTCSTSFFPVSPSCSLGDKTEAAMMGMFDDLKSSAAYARPCIHYFRGIYSSGGHPDWPRH